MLLIFYIYILCLSILINIYFEILNMIYLLI